MMLIIGIIALLLALVIIYMLIQGRITVIMAVFALVVIGLFVFLFTRYAGVG